MSKPAPLQILQAAVAHHQAGKLTEAEQLYRQVLEQDPNQPDALNLLGVIAQQTGNLKEALGLFDRALSAAPELAAAHYNRANTLRDAGRIGDAQAAYEAALTCDPGFQDALLNLGVLLYENGQTDDALEHFTTLARLAPGNSNAHYNIGRCHHARNRLNEACSALSQSLALNPQNPDAQFALANVYADMIQYDDAITHIKAALNLKPNWPEAYTNWANYLLGLDQHEEALTVFNQALKLDPENINARVNRSLALLAMGRLKEGWEDHSARDKSDSPFYRTFESDVPRWHSEDLSNKAVLIWNEQGLGEEILYAGLLRDLAKTTRACTLLCSNKLTPVFKRSFADIVNLHITDEKNRAVNRTDFDFQLSLVDLGRLFRPSLAAFHKASPYLAYDKTRRSEIRVDLELKYGEEKKFVGISWASSNPIIGSQKTIPLLQWSLMFSTPGVQFVNVQYGASVKDITALPEHLKSNIVSVESIDLNGGLDETLALLAALDLVITCSNTTAHLAGAAGLKTWVLVPAGRARIWYWFLEGHLSPWYAATEVFRQSASGDWTAIINSMAEQLRTHI
jgi:tetratricopeptide (TPR) repeat protein